MLPFLINDTKNYILCLPHVDSYSEAQKPYISGSYEKSVGIVSDNEIYHQDQHHWDVLKSPTLSIQFCACKQEEATVNPNNL